MHAESPWMAWSLGGPEVAILFLLAFGGLVVLGVVLGLQKLVGGKASGKPSAGLSAETDAALRRLAQLRQDGVLTEAEFEAKKRSLLEGGG